MHTKEDTRRSVELMFILSEARPGASRGWTLGEEESHLAAGKEEAFDLLGGMVGDVVEGLGVEIPRVQLTRGCLWLPLSSSSAPSEMRSVDGTGLECGLVTNEGRLDVCRGSRLSVPVERVSVVERAPSASRVYLLMPLEFVEGELRWLVQVGTEKVTATAAAGCSSSSSLPLDCLASTFPSCLSH